MNWNTYMGIGRKVLIVDTQLDQGRVEISMAILLVGVGGGSGSGKTTLCRALQKELGADKVSIIGTDWYMTRDVGSHNRPEAIDEKRLLKDLDLLSQGKTIVRGRRLAEPAPIVLIEGHLVFCLPHLVEKLDLKVFIDMDPEERLLRRISRNVLQAGLELEGVVDWYRKDVQANYWEFIEPTKKMADLIIWGDGDPRKAKLLGAFLVSLQEHHNCSTNLDKAGEKLDNLDRSPGKY